MTEDGNVVIRIGIPHKGKAAKERRFPLRIGICSRVPLAAVLADRSDLNTAQTTIPDHHIINAAGQREFGFGRWRQKSHQPNKGLKLPHSRQCDATNSVQNPE